MANMPQISKPRPGPIEIFGAIAQEARDLSKRLEALATAIEEAGLDVEQQLAQRSESDQIIGTLRKLLSEK